MIEQLLSPVSRIPTYVQFKTMTDIIFFVYKMFWGNVLIHLEQGLRKRAWGEAVSGIVKHSRKAPRLMTSWLICHWLKGCWQWISGNERLVMNDRGQSWVTTCWRWLVGHISGARILLALHLFICSLGKKYSSLAFCEIVSEFALSLPRACAGFVRNQSIALRTAREFFWVSERG